MKNIKQKLYKQGIVPIIAIIIGLIIAAGIVGIVTTQRKAPPAEKPLFVSEEEAPSDQEQEQEKEHLSEIINEFAKVNIPYLDGLSDKDKAEVKQNLEELLVQAFEPVTNQQKDKLKITKEKLGGAVAQDAPSGRSLSQAFAKLCIAESIILNNAKNTLINCNRNDTRPQDVDWETSTLESPAVDDINAVSQTLPYLVSGVAYYVEGELGMANYYFRQVKLHKQAGLDWLGNDFLLVAGDIYEMIVAKANELSQ